MTTSSYDTLVTLLNTAQQNSDAIQTGMADIGAAIVQTVLASEGKGANGKPIEGKVKDAKTGKTKTVRINRALLARYARNTLSDPEKLAMFEVIANISPAVHAARAAYADLVKQIGTDKGAQYAYRAELTSARDKANAVTRKELDRPVQIASVLLTSKKWNADTVYADTSKGQRVIMHTISVTGHEPKAQSVAYADIIAEWKALPDKAHQRDTRNRASSKTNGQKPAATAGKAAAVVSTATFSKSRNALNNKTERFMPAMNAIVAGLKAMKADTMSSDERGVLIELILVAKSKLDAQSLETLSKRENERNADAN